MKKPVEGKTPNNARRDRRRIYILPTLFGVTFGLALFMMLLMAYTYQNNLAYGLTFFLTAFGAAAMFATHRVLEGFRGTPHPPGLLTEGEDFPSPFRGGEDDVPDSAYEVRPLSAAFSAHEGRWRALRRGVHEVRRSEVRTTFPAGLFRAWTRLESPVVLTVAPAARDFGLRPGAGAAPGEERRDRRRPGEPEELQGLAPAREEEPAARIDWPALARGRGWLKKEFDADDGPDTVLRWEDTESLGDPENRLRQMAAWIRDARGRLKVQGPSGRWFDRRDEALTDLARHPETT